MLKALQGAVSYTGLVAMTCLLVALVARRFHRVCLFFTLFIAAALFSDLLITIWPGRFFNWSFWIGKETVGAVLNFGIAFELAGLILAAFPGARSAMRRVLAVSLLLILGTFLVDPITVADEAPLALQLQPRLANGAALVLICLWALTIWYHLPLHPIHRAILHGLVPYLLVFTVCTGMLHTLGSDLLDGLGLANSFTFVSITIYWAWTAWCTEPAPPVHPEVVRCLQPWRDRL